MARRRRMAKAPGRKTGGAGIDYTALKLTSVVGERKNYNFQPGVTEYDLWPFSTIEWVAAEGKYRARAMVQHRTTHDMVAFNSWHQDFGDAERPIDLLRHSLQGTAERPLYNIFGETLEVHTADIGTVVNVTEVLALIWSMTES